ncbi:plectin [Actinocorallia populi]|uniref:plectin n=1 Tax=Actinocorallia populi TaxID=2079200 RepID=UPI000D08E66F|nr:plectin [Actinocorallia populi]
MVFGRRTSPEDAARYAADREIAGGYPDRIAAVERADAALREAQAEGGDGAGLRGLHGALEAALREAITAAEAAERVAMGPRTYGSTRAAEISRRKARAKASVRPYSEELDRLRTAREAHKLSFRALTRV